MSAPDLLPCPFCGGPDLSVYKGHGGKKVKCFGCSVSGVDVGVWNRRADLAAAQTKAAVRAALADALGIVSRSEGDVDFAEFQLKKAIARLDAEVATR